MVAAMEPVSSPQAIPSDAKTAVVVNGTEKPTAISNTPITTTSTGKAVKKGKNQLRREKKKQRKAQEREGSVVTESESESESVAASSNVRLNLVPESTPDFKSSDLELDESDPNFAEYQRILQKFNVVDDAKAIEDKGEIMGLEDDMIPDEPEENPDVPKLSKKARKARDKLSVAELKALVKRPETVEWTDTSAQDPRLLVHLKSYRNCVPVPNHWSLKREYLSSKRGMEKPPFELPKFIRDTGIMEMRDSVKEKEEAQTLKSKIRERVQPKMGKLDIDYQKLHDAFFRFQTKPPLTMYGEIYYEGKEYETNLKDRRPGELSEELKEALNIPPGAPPPWLINMQRFGPPPSYPSLKIPGLNAPIPAGAQWGFHPGGYGKPPTDEYNRPLYGDVFGVLQAQAPTQTGEPVEKTLWGELVPEEDGSSSEEEEDDEEEEEGDEEFTEGLTTPSGMDTPSGMVSAVPSEFEPVDGGFELRKRRDGTETEEDTVQKSLYTVLPEQNIRAKGFFGGERAYDISKATRTDLPVLGQEDRKRKKPGDIEVTLDPSELENSDGLSSEAVKAQYEAQQEAQRRESQGFQEDLSDMIAAESRKRQKRDEENAKRKKDNEERIL
ncbi:uncharacterized protein LAJ45_01594 [Morchella importuna]|uniref:uncharacterized protein n=1 Tax=Morchella importuna TaxID=1174673 RepID=UPI001E8DA013|nr:uncharacterized protein LAJ45_01594 [Morchella importuna]KAH8153827.1 hypothetical protein LAJ45_01594 [Morchella importuna]